jgi:hypothetical protein
MAVPPRREDVAPTQRRGRIANVLWSIGFLALGVSMIIWPDAIFGDTDRPRRLLGHMIFWLGARPVGIVITLLGVVIGWVAFIRNDQGN